VVKNGSTRHGKQNYKCRDCGRQFVENPQWQRVSDRIQDNYDLLERLLLEKIPLAGIARVLKVSERWLQSYVNHKYENVPQQVEVEPKPKRRLTVQMDELWSFVDNKGNKQWVWLAIDAETREIVGCYIGDRSGESAQKLWESLPAVYRQCAVIYTDFSLSYPVALPSNRHRAVGKETGKTNYIERFNCTLRQRVSRALHIFIMTTKNMILHNKGWSCSTLRKCNAQTARKKK
jgi:IS1 family transposase